MVRAHLKALTIGAITVTVSSLCLAFPDLLPSLHPLTSQLLVRLQEVLAFLAFTTAIAVGILTSQRKDAARDNRQNTHFLEHDTIIGSIFGDPGNWEANALNADSGRHDLSPSAQRAELGQTLHGTYANDFITDNSFAATDEAFFPQSMELREASMKALPAGRAPTNDDNSFAGRQNEQRSLHRKSSSLDDEGNNVPGFKALHASSPETVNDTHGVFARNKPTKRVSFYMASSPPRKAESDQSISQSEMEHSEKDRRVSASSPGDLTGKADAFIAKFKEQLRMQNLESFPKYHQHA